MNLHAKECWRSNLIVIKITFHVILLIKTNVLNNLSIIVINDLVGLVPPVSMANSPCFTSMFFLFFSPTPLKLGVSPKFLTVGLLLFSLYLLSSDFFRV